MPPPAAEIHPRQHFFLNLTSVLWSAAPKQIEITNVQHQTADFYLVMYIEEHLAAEEQEKR